MKHRILSFLVVIFLITCCTPAQAGFIMKHRAAADSAASISVKQTIQQIETKGLVNTLREFRQDQKTLIQRPGSSSGWEGIVALVCGILGFFFGFPAILAIIFGAMGMGRNKRHRGMAVAGFVLGIVVTVILLLALLLAFAFIGWLF